MSSGSGEWTQEEQAPLSSVKKASRKEGGESSEQKREQQKRKRDEALQSDEEREDEKEDDDDDDRDFERWRSLLYLPLRCKGSFLFENYIVMRLEMYIFSSL